MENITAEINGVRYYFDIGFETVTNITLLTDDPTIFQDGEVINGGKLCLEVIKISGALNHPDANWPALISTVPPECYKEIWDIADAIGDHVQRVKGKQQQPAEVGSDEWMKAQGA